MVCQSRTRLVIDLKPSIKLESSQQLREEVALWFSIGQGRDRTANLWTMNAIIDTYIALHKEEDVQMYHKVAAVKKSVKESPSRQLSF